MRSPLLPLAIATIFARAADAPPPAADWTHYVRIAGHSLSASNAGSIVQESQSTNVYGIEVDNDIPGRYESFEHPEAKLLAIRNLAEAAHRGSNKAFVYIAGLECITAQADRNRHTFYKDHPDWVQRTRDGKPAVFGGGTAFWIARGDEDVWISPFAPEWRKRYMDIVRRIALTGIDGVYVDIPYWMTHFKGWEDSWASFDPYTVKAFRERTGIDALHDVRPGDVSDPGFRAWVQFRIDAITEFVGEIAGTVKSVNPQCIVIPEIFPGIGEEVPRVGADVSQLYPISGVIAHEYQGPTDTIGASRTQDDWRDAVIGMLAFRAFADGKATWMLNYSWDGETAVAIPDAMRMLFASQLFAGANSWDAQGHVMSGSNDRQVRRQVFDWIKAHEHTFYDPRLPVEPVGLYFPAETRNLYPKQVSAEFTAAMKRLLEEHREFQIVTLRTARNFRGKSLLVPALQSLLPGDAGSVQSSRDAGVSVKDSTAPFTPDPTTTIHTGADVMTQTARVNGKLHVFFLNLRGIIAKKNVIPESEKGAQISLSAQQVSHVYALPYLGTVQELSTQSENGRLTIRVPEFRMSTVVWVE